MTSNYNKKENQVQKLHFSLIVYHDIYYYMALRTLVCDIQPSVLRFRFLSFYQFDKIADNYLAFGGYNAFWMELNPLQF
jgi:hypothetical protein